jgi:hypothetical protein
MTRRRILAILTVIGPLVAIALVTAPPPTVSAQAKAAATDTRQRLKLTVAEGNAVRAEMRQMLASVNGVLQGLASGDLAAVDKAATASGMAAAVDPHLEHKLPRQFVELGERTHRGFDELAGAAKAGAPSTDLLKRFAGVTGSCVACHALYRLGDAR